MNRISECRGQTISLVGPGNLLLSYCCLYVLAVSDFLLTASIFCLFVFPSFCRYIHWISLFARENVPFLRACFPLFFSFWTRKLYENRDMTFQQTTTRTPFQSSRALKRYACKTHLIMTSLGAHHLRMNPNRDAHVDSSKASPMNAYTVREKTNNQCD